MAVILRRALFHILSGLSIAIAALLLPRAVLLVALGAATAAFLSLDLVRLKVPLINRWFTSLLMLFLKEKEACRLTGSSYMLVASLITLLVFPRDIAVLAICFLAVGDAAAVLVGSCIGRRKLFGKTVAGILTCFVSCVAVGLILYQMGLGISVLTVIVGAVAATVAEALPLPVNDNLTMPLFSGLVMTLTQI